jgi:primosomal protein N' (replication factor Y) (superfamily II helicase)
VEIFEDSDDTYFAELLLPVPIPRLFTYRVPRVLQDKILVGQRAIVQFGDRKILTGLISTIHKQPPADYEAKYILEVLDNYPVVTELQFKLFRWIADYYLCSLGEVMNAALPSGLKLSSESMVQLNPSFSLEESTLEFTDREIQLLRHLANESMDYSSISKLLGVRNVYSILKSLVHKEAIILFEQVREKYKPKTEKKVRLVTEYNNADALEHLFQALASKPKQEAVLLKYLQEVPVLSQHEKNRDGITKKELLCDGLSESSLSTLIKNNVFEEFDVVVSRFPVVEKSAPHTVQLSEEQQRVQHEILKHFQEDKVTLLRGITGSGKTEIYINLIKQALDAGSQVLYLLPEIAVTTQIVQRLKKIFGETVGVYHSRFSDNERVEVWNGILHGKYRFIIGVRSSVMLPFDNLALIIVDEEHDPSYKQQEPAPRYNARDVAMVMGQMHYSKVLLGSATPSLETFYHAQQAKYGFVILDKRFGDAQLPTVELADMGQERKQKTNKGDFSGLLLKRIDETLAKKQQVIIFQNRRGYSPMVSCDDCGWIPKCVNCAVSLTYHQYKHALVCHYCGYRQQLPEHCPTCTSARIKTMGYGTEKLEEELNLHFPNAKVQRMDLDTTRSKTGYETIIEQFEREETNILVGTQMVTKGLDFNHVNLVGIFNADRMMHFPDFRSYERAFQLITQVSGRAGRRDKPGTVVIQTSNPQHPLLHVILNHDHEKFYEAQLSDRYLHDYPPFARLIELTVKHTDKKVCHLTAGAVATALREKLTGVKVFGPGEPVISKIRNQFLLTILVKIPRGKADLLSQKHILQGEIEKVLKIKQHRNSRVIIDVDPA